MEELDYILGRSRREIQRLIQQADIIRPITERLLMRLNIGPGAGVLDLGCGAGDVSMLVAELAGPTGRVIGIDQNAEVLAIATERASKADLSHIVFEQASLESFSTTESFNLADKSDNRDPETSEAVVALAREGRPVEPNGGYEPGCRRKLTHCRLTFPGFAIPLVNHKGSTDEK
jgi:SAM-dependent methyltransferase